VDEFLTVAAGINGLRRDNDRTFVKTWLKLSIEASSAEMMFESPEAHDQIRRREKITRPSKSRLHHAEYLQRWKPPTQSDIDGMADDPDGLRYSLDYRSDIGSTFVRDIVSGLEGAS
jgi:hypothetical protein